MIRRIERLGDAPAVRNARVWIDARSRREQILLAGLAVVAALAIAWYGGVQPVLRMREAAGVRIETAAQLMTQLAAARPGQAVSVQTPLEGSVADVVGQRATASGLSPSQVEADGDAVDVVIEDARYDAVIPFIAALEGVDDATVDDLRIERAGQPGMVRLQMRVSRP